MPSINEVEDAAVNINEPDAPKQKKLEKEITSLQADIINLQRKRDSNMMTGNDRKELQEKKELLKVTEKSLRARKSATERQRKLRLKRKDAMDEIDPILRKKLRGKDDGTRGRPRKPSNSNSSAQTEEELLKTIAEIACTGSAADERRRSEMIRTIKTLDELTDELHKRGFELSRSAVYLRILPRRSLSAEGKRHVKTAPVRLIRAQNSQHCNHPDTKFAKSSIQSMEEIAALLGPKEVTFHSQVQNNSPARLFNVSIDIYF